MDKKSFNVAAAGILGAVDAAGSLGAPGGILYAGLMSKGYSFNDYSRIMVALASAGLLAQEAGADAFTLTAKGAELNAKIDAALSQQRAAA